MEDILEKCTKRKLKTMSMQQAYQMIADQDQRNARYLGVAMKMNQCSSLLAFKRNTQTNKRKLWRANFCKNRFCPFCSWRKSQKNFLYLNETLKVAKARDKGLRYIFLTLTIPNTGLTGEELKEGVQRLLEAFRGLVHEYLKRHCPAYRGSFRNMEVTINLKDGTFHPHLHVLLAVDKTYFDKNSPSYITQEKLSEVWANLCKEKKAFVYMQSVKEKNEEKAILELTKYTTKDEEILTGNPDEQAALLLALDQAMFGVRATSYTGVLRPIYQELKQKELNPDAELFPDLLTVIEFYRWNGHSNYLLTSSVQVSAISSEQLAQIVYDLGPDG